MFLVKQIIFFNYSGVGIPSGIRNYSTNNVKVVNDKVILKDESFDFLSEELKS